MNTLISELNETRQLSLVDRAFVTEDYGKVIIELRRDTTLGLRHKNILYFLPTEFSASEVEEAINQIVGMMRSTSV
jgi:hypothetical protein